MGKVIGIDLGTTNSVVAVLEGDRAVIIPSASGQRTTPSVVGITAEGDRLIGDIARRQAAVNNDRTVLSIKRRMGTDYRVVIDEKSYSPQEISAMILSKLKKDAEDYLEEKVTEAVITVPAYFNDAQRQATKDAGRIAGLEVLRIINEPTAAALAYGLDHGEGEKILVYDLGGGTFDVSVIEIGDGLIEVLSTAGDNRLGGDDFDKKLCDFIIREFQRENRVRIDKDPVAVQRVLEAAEQVKKELSVVENYNLNIPFLAMKKNEQLHLSMNITRQMFEEITKDLYERTRQPVQNALEDAGLKPSDIDRVLLVGGSTRIPAVSRLVREMLGREPSKNINPDECVAIGAAVQGGKIGGFTVASSKDIILMDVTPLSLSIETAGGIAHHIIDRNTTIPVKQSQIFTTSSNFQTSVDVKVYQGERRFTRDNVLLGNFRLEGIKRALRGTPQIEVTFDIDVNGILSVEAKDLGTGNMQKITITSRDKMSEEEISQAMLEAAEYEDYELRRNEIQRSFDEAIAYAKETERWLLAAKPVLDRDIYKNIRAQKDRIKKLTAASVSEADEAQKKELEMEVERLREMREGL